MTDQSHNVTEAELRAFVTRVESQNARIKDETELRADIFKEAKGRGYSAKAIRAIVAERARNPDDVANDRAVEDLYKSALGMN